MIENNENNNQQEEPKKVDAKRHSPACDGYICFKNWIPLSLLAINGVLGIAGIITDFEWLYGVGFGGLITLVSMRFMGGI